MVKNGELVPFRGEDDPVKTVFGVTCRDDGESIVREVWSGIYEREAQVRPGDIVVDAGAHIGSFSLLVSDKARRIIAFEPEPENFELLRLNAAPHGNIEAHRKALWSGTGEGKLYHNRSNSGGHSLLGPGGATDYALDVDLVRLDEVVEEANFIKMDVEGAEIEALKGSSEILRSCHPVIVLEVHPIEPLRDWWGSLQGALTHYGYDIKNFPLEEDLWCRRIVTAR